MNLENLILMPSSINKVHESCYRGVQVLNVVLEMVERGDSKETILELSDFLRNYSTTEEQK